MGNSNDGERAAEEWSPEELSTERGLRLTADPYRRSLLRILFASEEERLSFEELAGRIEARTADASSEEVATVLRHTHIPKLTANDVVEFDPETGTVALSEGAAGLEALLDFVDRDA